MESNGKTIGQSKLQWKLIQSSDSHDNVHSEFVKVNIKL